jgi:hypothetical protein
VDCGLIPQEPGVSYVNSASRRGTEKFWPSDLIPAHKIRFNLLWNCTPRWPQDLDPTILTTATLFLIMATHWRINGRRLFFNIRPLLEHGGARTQGDREVRQRALRWIPTRFTHPTRFPWTHDYHESHGWPTFSKRCAQPPVHGRAPIHSGTSPARRNLPPSRDPMP